MTLPYTPSMTIVELNENLKHACKTLLAFQDRYQTNPNLTQRAARVYAQVINLQCHVQKTLDPTGHMVVGNPHAGSADSLPPTAEGLG